MCNNKKNIWNIPGDSGGVAGLSRLVLTLGGNEGGCSDSFSFFLSTELGSILIPETKVKNIFIRFKVIEWRNISKWSINHWWNLIFLPGSGSIGLIASFCVWLLNTVLTFVLDLGTTPCLGGGGGGVLFLTSTLLTGASWPIVPGFANIFWMEAIRGEIFSLGSLKNVSLATLISWTSRSVNDTFEWLPLETVDIVDTDESTLE